MAETTKGRTGRYSEELPPASTWKLEDLDNKNKMNLSEEVSVGVAILLGLSLIGYGLFIIWPPLAYLAIGIFLLAWANVVITKHENLEEEDES